MRTNGDAGNASWIFEGLVALDDGGGAAEEDSTAKSGDRVGSWSEKFRGFCGIPFELLLSDQCRRPTSKSCDECPGMGITLACSAFLSRDDLLGVFTLYPVISGEGRIHHDEILGQAMYVDPKFHTMATLYGNPTVMEGVQKRGTPPSGGPRYPTGAVLALVTWAQRDDPHWFGGRIPDLPESVEFVQVEAAGQTINYQRFAGNELIEEHPVASVAAQRTSFMLGLTLARLP
jgi:hypothetical protein